MIIAIMIMGLLAIFVAASLSRVTTGARIMGNDYQTQRAFYAAQAGLERMTLNFSKIFLRRFTPIAADEASIEAAVPAIDGVQLVQDIDQIGGTQTVSIEEGDYAGLFSQRDPWRLTATATTDTGEQVRLTRLFYNNRIPIFQFGIFYDDAVEFHPGPAFNFGGRVHSNSDLYLAASTGLSFRSRVSAAGQVVTDYARNGTQVQIVRPSSGSYAAPQPVFPSAPWPAGHNGTGNWGQVVTVRDADSPAVNRRVMEGSVVGGPDTVDLAATPPDPDDPDVPNGTANPGWDTYSTQFDGNLVAKAGALRLPLQIEKDDPIEIVRRGLATDTDLMRPQRYCNKGGIRVYLGDTQASVGGGGVRLDGDAIGNSATANADAATGAKGYWPAQLLGTPVIPRPTRVNGHRMYTDNTTSRQHWIKIEVVTLDAAGNPVPADRTADFLSLGTTKRQTITLPSGATTTVGDEYAIFCLQQFAVRGEEIVAPTTPYAPNNATGELNSIKANRSTITEDRTSGVNKTRNLYTHFGAYNDAVNGWNVVRVTDTRTTATTAEGNASNTDVDVIYDRPNAFAPRVTGGVASPEAQHVLAVADGGGTMGLVPFPIRMFDTREGLYNDNLSSDSFTNSQITYCGSMGMLEINMRNLSRFLSGELNTRFPGGLASTMVPGASDTGVIVYVSDRRGDADDDGLYDMENVYVTNPATDPGVSGVTAADPGEDLSNDTTVKAPLDGKIQVDYANESARYSELVKSDLVATSYPEGGVAGNVVCDKKYRRGVRLVDGEALRYVNGSFVFGDYDTGMSVASENGIYIQGNYNASGINPTPAPSGGSPTTFDNYLPYATDATPDVGQLPCSVVADAVTILSTAWRDGESFQNPFRMGKRTTGETTVRTALLMGDTKTARNGTPNQGGGDPRMSGGVHNFKRFLENWTSRLNYCGSLINLFNSRNNNGAFKCCNNTYSPPVRNWVFDESFLDPDRIPPGTPFFQYIQVTGFRTATS